MLIGDLGEHKWIERLSAMLGPPAAGVVVGVGDDAALLEPSAERLLVATGDVQVAGVHFLLDQIEPSVIGRRTAAVNLSDLAAMGAVPRWALASICAAPSTDVTLLDEIYRGLISELELGGAQLVGGNTSRVADGLMLDLFLIGEVERELALLRCGARDGDAICVTGELGAAGAGLLLLEGAARECGLREHNEAMARLAQPAPRLSEGRLLARSKAVSACIDISDGLLADAGQIAKASAVTLVIDAARVPIASAAEQVADVAGRDALELALGGGDDFELLFTVAGDRAADVCAAIEDECGTPCRRIGRVEAGVGEVRVECDGQVIDPPRAGFDHFSR